MNAPSDARARVARHLPSLIILALVALVIAFVLTYEIFGSGVMSSMLATMQATPDYKNLILVNLLIGASVALFIAQLRWTALRVTVTVLVALFLGFFVTLLFNAGVAVRFTRGEFRAAVISTALPSNNDQMDLQYVTARGCEFNKDKVKDPLKQASYRFEGHQGDVVSVLAYASGSQSVVNLEVALLNAQRTQLPFSPSSTPEQLPPFSPNLNTPTNP